METAGTGRMGELALRCASAAVLAPACLWAAFQGGWPAALLAAAAAAVAAFEWAGLSGCSISGRRWAAAVQIPAAAVAVLYGPAAGYAAALAGAAVVSAACRASGSRFPWPAAAGTAYCGAFAVAAACLGGGGAQAYALPWLLAVVWASDIGAYFAGRALGGPRLAPTVSPGKTWSGLAGAAACAAAAGACGSLLGAGPGAAWAAAAMGLCLGLLGQCADLLESAMKRRAGVKDSGALIPGHGGMLDRIDALMACAPALLLAWGP